MLLHASCSVVTVLPDTQQRVQNRNVLVVSSSGLIEQTLGGLAATAQLMIWYARIGACPLRTGSAAAAGARCRRQAAPARACGTPAGVRGAAAGINAASGTTISQSGSRCWATQHARSSRQQVRMYAAAELAENHVLQGGAFAYASGPRQACVLINRHEG